MQGYLKKIELDSSREGYSNFMAPLRMQMVEADAEYAREHSTVPDVDKIFNTRILKPSTDTYLTPEWDEFVPFPTSKSTYLSPSQRFSPSLSLFLTHRVTDSLPFQHGKSASTASGPLTTVGQRMGSSNPSSKSLSPASLTTFRPSTNLKAPANTAAPSPTRDACAMVPEQYVGVNTVPSRWIRLRMGMSRWGGGRRCRPNGRSSSRPGVGCQANICPELLDD